MRCRTSVNSSVVFLHKKFVDPSSIHVHYLDSPAGNSDALANDRQVGSAIEHEPSDRCIGRVGIKGNADPVREFVYRHPPSDKPGAIITLDHLRFVGFHLIESAGNGAEYVHRRDDALEMTVFVIHQQDVHRR